MYGFLQHGVRKKTLWFTDRRHPYWSKSFNFNSTLLSYNSYFLGQKKKRTMSISAWVTNKGHVYRFISVYDNMCQILPALSSRHRLSYNDYLEDKRENYQNYFVLCCVWHLCTMIHTHTSSSYSWLLVLGLDLVFVCLFRFSILCFAGLAETICLLLLY